MIDDDEEVDRSVVVLHRARVPRSGDRLHRRPVRAALDERSRRAWLPPGYGAVIGRVDSGTGDPEVRTGIRGDAEGGNAVIGGRVLDGRALPDGSRSDADPSDVV